MQSDEKGNFSELLVAPTQTILDQAVINKALLDDSPCEKKIKIYNPYPNIQSSYELAITFIAKISIQ